MEKNELYHEICEELQLAGIKEVDLIIRGMCIAFDVEFVTQDVVDALREDYLDE